MEKSLIQEFCGRTPAEQARLNLDKARQKTTVLKYANYFREQLLELPHRHEEDNVHDFQRGLRPSIHKEVALKSPKTLHEAIQAALQAEAAETKIETTQRSTGRLNAIEEDNDFSEATEEIDSASEEDSYGATEEKPRELYEIRRLTQEEVDRFLWKRIRQDVKDICERCVVCRQAKIQPQMVASLYTLHVPPIPWHTVGLDYLTHLLESNDLTAS
jgi:hypothetical protein